MKGFSETYRGDVEAWECDAFGHMNIAFYAERFGDAAASRLAGVAPGRAWCTVSLFVRYATELRAGESISIDSGILGTGAGPAKGETVARLGHELKTGAGTVATMAQHALAPRESRMRGGLKSKINSEAGTWTADPFKPVHLPAAHGALPSLRDRVKSWELDERGQLSLLGHVRRFSTASSHLMNAVGMTAEYIQQTRRGFSTFETRLALVPVQPGAGTEVAATSGFLRLGNSSVVMIHDLVDVRRGERIARFYQAGVHFDLDRRKSAPMPDAMRHKAGAWTVKSG